MALAFSQILGVHQLPSPQMSEFLILQNLLQYMQITPQSTMIHKEPKNKQPSTKIFFHCNSSLMLGMMDGKLGFNKGKFVGL